MNKKDKYQRTYNAEEQNEGSKINFNCEGTIQEERKADKMRVMGHCFWVVVMNQMSTKKNSLKKQGANMDKEVKEKSNHKKKTEKNMQRK